MDQGLQFLKELNINPKRKLAFSSSLEYSFNNCLDLLGEAATKESLRDCLCAIGLGLLNEVNHAPMATPSQIIAMQRLVKHVLESNTSRESRALFLKLVKKYIAKRL